MRMKLENGKRDRGTSWRRAEQSRDVGSMTNLGAVGVGRRRRELVTKAMATALREKL